jgi:Cof subfamily protein (haloacid dehalogenase superfamily)
MPVYAVIIGGLMLQFQAQGKISSSKSGQKRHSQDKTSQSGKQQVYKLAAIDLDGTLLNPERRISAENRAAVEKLIANDVQVVLASGRRHDDIYRFHEELGLKTPILSCHGALVKDPFTGEVFCTRPIEQDLVLFLLKEALEVGLNWVVYDEKGVHLCHSEYWINEYIRRTDFGCPTTYKSISEYDLTHAEKVNWMGDPEAIQQQYRRMVDLFHGKLTCVVTDPDHLEFTLHGADNASGLMALIETLGITSDEVITFGDSNNDVTMLSWAGLGVAMGHGTPAAKMAAKMISEPGDEGTSLARAVNVIFPD